MAVPAIVGQPVDKTPYDSRSVAAGQAGGGNSSHLVWNIPLDITVITKAGSPALRDPRRLRRVGAYVQVVPSIFSAARRPVALLIPGQHHHGGLPIEQETVRQLERANHFQNPPRKGLDAVSEPGRWSPICSWSGMRSARRSFRERQRLVRES
jgi:hypothetical protein